MTKAELEKQLETALRHRKQGYATKAPRYFFHFINREIRELTYKLAEMK
jgi:hypothetical protein